ncbi:hypothetical protein F383_11142 [Gossypium arboreum]|uniref:Uncharacterized protein n=1 Tax=Gossypium arboreum TaxID=29729 RepID=A0A0B0PSY0_GOSAR|nr:hypothetical protein F383_11142 [Gossypium arboreum]
MYKLWFIMCHTWPRHTPVCLHMWTTQGYLSSPFCDNPD